MATARERIAAWLTANGINPDTVPQQTIQVATHPDGTRVIRYYAYPDGSAGLIEERREAPLIAEFTSSTP